MGLSLDFLLEFVREPISYDDEPEVESFAQLEQHISLQLAPVTFKWCYYFLILLISVSDDARFAIEPRKCVDITGLFLLRPVAELGFVFSGWVGKGVPHPLIDRAVQLGDFLLLIFCGLLLSWHHLRILVPEECEYLSVDIFWERVRIKIFEDT